MKIPACLLAGLCCVAALRAETDYDAEAALRIQNFEYPDDFKVGLFADPSQTTNPSAICFDDEGRMYIGEIHRWRAGVEDIRHHIPMLIDDLSIVTSEDRLAMYRKHSETGYIPFERWTEYADSIRMVEDTDGDGRADKSLMYADDFRDPLDGPGIGLIHRDGKIYYTNIPHLWKLEDKDGDGVSDERESLQDGFGVRMSISGHDMHGLVWGPDGRLYWSIGDRGYTITTKEGETFSEPTEGAVFRCEPDGSNLEVFYHGLRNPQELAFDAWGNLFTCDNDADAWDTGRLVYLIEGGDSGWDAGHQALLNFHGDLNLRTPVILDERDNKERALNQWLHERICEPRNEDQPAWILPPIEEVSWGPSGLVYNYGGTAFPQRYENYFFICNFGGAKGDVEAFAMDPSGAGFELIDNHVFMVGLGNTDAEFGPDGRMYLSCFNNNGWVKQDIGNIYTIYSEERLADPAVKETGVLLTSDFSEYSPKKLIQLLDHVDMRVRQRAQFTLAKGGGDALPHFLTALASEDMFRRIHGMWGIWQISRLEGASEEGPMALIPHLSDPNPGIRVQAARVLGDLKFVPAADALTRLLKDDDEAVRSLAAIGLGKMAHQPAQDALVAALMENGEKDLFLRHGLVMGLHGLGDEVALGLTEHADDAVRMGALLALRRSQHTGLEAFLDDENFDIAAEAVRAIHDLGITEAMDEVAAVLERSFPAESLADWLVQTRLINANFRVGGEDAARRLLKTVTNESLPAKLRADALKAIEEWPQPNVADAVLGNVRPLEGERMDIVGLVKEAIPGILESSTGSLQAIAMRVARDNAFPIPDEVLLDLVQNTELDVEIREEALIDLTQHEEPALEGVIQNVLLVDENAELRARALEVLGKLNPEAAFTAAQGFIASENTADKQAGVSVLANLEIPEAETLLDQSLDEAIEGTFPKAVLLELLEAAAGDPELQEKAEQWRATQDSEGSIAGYQEALYGGNAKRGADLFANHAAGQCLKCHIVGQSGGVAGPDLSDIGKRENAHYILESIVNPTATIVPGYGMTLVFMKDGSSVGGNLVKETEDSIVLKIGEDGETQEVARADIQSMSPPISAMPPMGMMMKKSELRDLVSYLKAQKKAPRGGH